MDGQEQSGSPGNTPKRWGSIGGGRSGTPPRSRGTEVPPVADDEEPADTTPSDEASTDTSSGTTERVVELRDRSPHDISLRAVPLRDVGAFDPGSRHVASSNNEWLGVASVDAEEDDPQLAHGPADIGWLEPEPRLSDLGAVDADEVESGDVDFVYVDLVDAERTEHAADLRSVLADPPEPEAVHFVPVDVGRPDVEPEDPPRMRVAPLYIDSAGRNGDDTVLSATHPADTAPVSFTPVVAPPTEPVAEAEAVAPVAFPPVVKVPTEPVAEEPVEVTPAGLPPEDDPPLPATPLAVKGVAPIEDAGVGAANGLEPFGHAPLDVEKPLAIKGVAISPVEQPVEPLDLNAVDASLIGRPIGTVRKPWYRSIWFWVAVVALVGLALVLVALSAIGDGPVRIDARPAAPTPRGFRLVAAADHQFAIPRDWTAQELDAHTIDSLAKRADATIPDAGDALREAARNKNVSGTKTLAFDLGNGDNVNLIPYRALEGDPRDAGTLADIKQTFHRDMAGATRVGVAAKPGNVHGFPAATVTVNATVKGLPLTAISTIIQTGDHVYELTVTSQSFARATVLSRQIVPTFAPR